MTTKKSAARSEGARSEVRIAISDQVREITIEVTQEREEILSLVKNALASSEPLVLTDLRNRQYVVPAGKISSIEIGDSAERRVGFAGL